FFFGAIAGVGARCAGAGVLALWLVVGVGVPWLCASSRGPIGHSDADGDFAMFDDKRRVFEDAACPRVGVFYLRCKHCGALAGVIADGRLSFGRPTFSSYHPCGETVVVSRL